MYLADKRLLSIYKVPLIISITLAVVLLALSVAREPLEIAWIISGCLAGAFILDLEYLIFAYLLEPGHEFSKSLTGYINHKDIFGAVLFTQQHKDDIGEKSLNSGIFQIVLALLCIFVVYSSTMLFAKALVLATFANTMYKLFEHYYQNRLDEWFWALKTKPSRQGFSGYVFGLVAIFIYCLYNF